MLLLSIAKNWRLIMFLFNKNPNQESVTNKKMLYKLRQLFTYKSRQQNSNMLLLEGISREL